MFDFDNLVDLDNRSIQILMRTLEQEQMAYALKAAPEPVVEKFLSNMSQRAGAMFMDEMEMMGMVRVTDAEDAQRLITSRASRRMKAKLFCLCGWWWFCQRSAAPEVCCRSFAKNSAGAAKLS